MNDTKPHTGVVVVDITIMDTWSFTLSKVKSGAGESVTSSCSISYVI